MQPPDARSQINAWRRKAAVAQLFLLPLLAASCWWLLVKQHWPGETVIALVVGYMVISAMITRFDVCPSCQKDISFLPSEGHLTLPELSRAVTRCPFCGVDLTYKPSAPRHDPAPDPDPDPNLKSEPEKGA